MQLTPHMTDLLAAAGANAVAATPQLVLQLVALSVLLLVLTAGAVLLTARLRESSGQADVAALGRLLATSLRQAPGTNRDRSTANHFGSAREHVGHGGLRRRKLSRHARWRKSAAALAGLTGAASLLLALSWDIAQYRQNVMINIGADLVGALVTTFVIIPLVRRAADGRVREHPRLDHRWFVDQVCGATSSVRIMDTYSNLLDGPHTANFFRAVELALEREAVVRILLLNPDSLTYTPHAHEPDDPNAYREIMRNLRELYTFRNTVRAASLSRNFSVRLYTAPPPVTVYRWDEKILVSFLPAGRISNQSAQLEVTTGSPLGEFANEQFDSLWNMSMDLEKFMHLPVTLANVNVTDRYFEVEFVRLDGRFYVNDWRIASEMDRRTTEVTLAYSHYGQQVLNELTFVKVTQPRLHATLSDRFQDKYGHNGKVFVSLEPICEETTGGLQKPRQG